MSVLEAMSLGLPVVVTDSCGLAPLIRETASGVVVGPDLPALVAGVQRLLADPALAATMGANGRRTAATTLGMDQVAAVLVQEYRSACAGAGS
jgi:glycosyltransferase involved in cell wall biosynthesis